MTYKVTHKMKPNNESRLTLCKKHRHKMPLIEQAAQALGVASAEVVSLGESREKNSPPLTYVPNSKPRVITCSSVPYPRTRFGRNAIDRIMCAGGMMDKIDSESSHYLFLTATLPGNDDWSKWGIAVESHHLINGLKAWVSKRVKTRLEFYVWELQKRGALHFHYCMYVPDAEAREWIKLGFRAEWTRLLNNAGKKLGISLWGKHESLTFEEKCSIVQARVEVVYSSVNAYMAGYFADGSSKHKDDHKHPYYPKRWFGISRPLSAKMAEYTQEKAEEFESLKEANEYMHKKEEDLIDDALTHRNYPHTIGEGRTHIFYHLPGKQLELWQENSMLTHNQKEHPLIASLIQSILTVHQTGSRLCSQSRVFRERLSPSCLDYLEDSTYLISLRRGALSLSHIRLTTAMYSCSDWSTSSAYGISSLSTKLLKANKLISRYHSQMTWNQYGWLNNEFDFVDEVDNREEENYHRTMPQGRSDTGGTVNLAPSQEHTEKCPPSQISLTQPEQLSMLSLERYSVMKQLES